jgi:hypothetical protein
MKKCDSCGSIVKESTMAVDENNRTSCPRCNEVANYLLEVRATEHGIQVAARSPSFEAQYSSSWDGIRHAVESIRRRPVMDKEAPKLRAVSGKES